MNDFTASQEI